MQPGFQHAYFRNVSKSEICLLSPEFASRRPGSKRRNRGRQHEFEQSQIHLEQEFSDMILVPFLLRTRRST